jgi:hypothetical protein
MIYTAENLDNILKKVRNNENITIADSEHFIDNTERKYCEYNFIYELIKTHNPLNIKLSKNNKFTVVYENYLNNDYYIVLVIFIKNLNELRLVTTFPVNIKRGGKYL